MNGNADPPAQANRTARLRLYVARPTPNSAQAERNLSAALDGLDDKGVGLGLEIVDVVKEPQRGNSDGVVVTPTLIGVRADGLLTMIGDLSDKTKLTLLLQSLRDEQTISKMKTLIAQKDDVLAEKAVMAEELQHRVKNHLQLVQGMLDAHLRGVSGSDEKASIDGIIRRVATLTAVYDQLLGTGMSNRVDLGIYIKTLCTSLPQLQATQEKDVTINCNADSMLVDLDTVTLMGMVVAETISNSYKHAFSDAGGTIDVTLRRSKALEGTIIVSDNGLGFTERAGSKRHGVGLVRRMMQRVNGSADLSSTEGTSWMFRFPVA